MGVGRNSTVVTTRFEEVRAGEELIPPLPAALERHIRVVKDSDTLGVQVDIEEEGINGLVVRYVSRKLNNMIQHNIWGFIRCTHDIRKLFEGYFLPSSEKGSCLYQAFPPSVVRTSPNIAL